MEKNQKKAIYTMVESAVLVALALAISFVKINIGALGGSIDFVMVPLFIICYRNGLKYGILSGMAFGILYCLISGGIGWGLPSVLLDYVLAYGACGIAGIFKGKYKLIEVSAFLGCFARFIIHFISGVTIYAITTSTEVGGIITSSAFIYSVVYNALYMLPNTIIAVVVMSLLRLPLKKLEKINMK